MQMNMEIYRIIHVSYILFIAKVNLEHITKIQMPKQKFQLNFAIFKASNHFN